MDLFEDVLPIENTDLCHCHASVSECNLMLKKLHLMVSETQWYTKTSVKNGTFFGPKLLSQLLSPQWIQWLQKHEGIPNLLFDTVDYYMIKIPAPVDSLYPSI